MAQSNNHTTSSANFTKTIGNQGYLGVDSPADKPKPKAKAKDKGPSTGSKIAGVIKELFQGKNHYDPVKAKQDWIQQVNSSKK